MLSVRNCKFSLLLREYRSWHSTCYQAVCKSHITFKLTFSNSNWPWTLKKYDKSTFMEISGVFGICYHVHCQKILGNKPSNAFKSTHLSESITSEILDLWGSFLFSDYWKFHLVTENAKKMQQKLYHFLYNLIWFGNGKFSLLQGEYS